MRARALAAAALVLVALTGCTSGASGVTDVANDPDQNYVGGNGSTFYAAADRGDAVDFTSSSIDGATVSATDYRGQVLVLNFWYASCPPCRSEAPDLVSVSNDYSSKGVSFLGVNVRDGAPDATAFDTKFGVPYPSVLDADTGDVQLALSLTVPPNATPSTLVIDTQGRVAARILGQVESAAELSGYIDAVLEEG